MSPQSDPPQPSTDQRAAVQRDAVQRHAVRRDTSERDAVRSVRPRPVVSRRPASASRVEETSPAPLGFEALLKEINTVVELLERIDVALDQQVGDSPAALMADDAPIANPNHHR